MVYIDNFNAPFGRMKMCHMIADTTDELLDMVDKISVQRKWIQYPGTPNEHFDISLAKKQLALTAGATEINFRDYARMVDERSPKGDYIEFLKFNNVTDADFGKLEQPDYSRLLLGDWKP